jgi:hypothetical protein
VDFSVSVREHFHHPKKKSPVYKENNSINTFCALLLFMWTSFNIAGKAGLVTRIPHFHLSEKIIISVLAVLEFELRALLC